ncbi:leucyl aminopeptidase family protein [Inquilinus sp. CAU 1745]|uniref:leucyl aminopeptidase family protein n=1 Tax=Inquilinus sp. CAU 1745 TaxID=3140369 RepID=UPI00325B38F5
MPCFADDTAGRAVALTILARGDLDRWLETQERRLRDWVKATGFAADPGAFCLLPAGDGSIARVLAGVAADADLWALAGLPYRLPDGDYRLDGPLAGGLEATEAALGWALGAYRFDRYRKAERSPARLVPPDGCDMAAVENAALGTFLVRDLVTTPTQDMGPEELAGAAQALAREFGGDCRIVLGDDLLTDGYPAIHAVGRASTRAPRLIDLRWGDEDAPKVTLVGKGVCFDTGGLDLKTAAGMLLMKKDMGGGAHALGLARMIMAAGLKVRLRVLVPAVENMVAGNAFKPSDVLSTRKGLTVEVGNTDAEGRLVLCDALAEADGEKPELLIDFATLTGAARVALGPDLPAFFANDEETAAAFLAAAEREDDPIWRLPLWKPYAKMLKSSIADTNNIGEGGMAGSITAALFLEKFVSQATRWVHLDVYAWNGNDRPGRPKGGEAMGLRAAYALIAGRFGA